MTHRDHPRAITLHIEDDGSISTLEQDGSVIASNLSWRDMDQHIGILCEFAMGVPMEALP